MIAQYGLHVLNQPGHPYTFETTRGRPNIDVTMASPDAIPLVKDWKVHEDGTSSDHRILETILDFGKRSTMPQLQERRYNPRKANWEVFQSAVMEGIKAFKEITLQRAEDVERMAGQLQATLIRACNAAIPKKK